MILQFCYSQRKSIKETLHLVHFLVPGYCPAVVSIQPLFRIGDKTLEVLLGIFLAEEIMKISGQYKDVFMLFRGSRKLEGESV